MGEMVREIPQAVDMVEMVGRVVLVVSECIL
jgi:hypothetical protein